MSDPAAKTARSSAFRRRRFAAWPALCCLALTPPAAAGQAAPSDNAQSRIDTMIAALGGRQAISELRSLAVEADCEGPDGAFVTRVESFRPDSVYFRQTAGDEATEIWSTSDHTWQLDAETGPKELEGARPFLRAHEFHMLLFELETRFSDHRLGETGGGSSASCRRIEMVDRSGQPAAVCIGQSDGLPLSLELNPAGAQGPIRIEFQDWRAIQGVQYFHSFVLTEGADRTFTYRYRSIEPDAVLAERFVLPTT